MDAHDSTNHDRPAHATMYALFESGILVILALSIFYHSEVAITKTSIKELINFELPQNKVKVTGTQNIELEKNALHLFNSSCILLPLIQIITMHDR